MKLDKWQQDFLACEGDKILCSGRQCGKSVICSIDAAQYLVSHPKVTVLMIAPLERQAYALFEKCLNYLVKNYPKDILKGKDRPTQTHVFLKNGSKLYCLPVGAGGLSIRFITINRLYVDEASQINSSVWSAVQPALLTTGGDSVYLSTPFGKQGEFYKCWINEDEAYNSFTRFSINSERVIAEREICDTWTEKQREKGFEKLKQAKSRMSNREYLQEFMGEFVEALSNYFPAELIRKCMTLPRVFHASLGEKAPEVSLYSSGDLYLGVDIASMGEDATVLVSVEKYGSDNDRLRMIDMEITEKTFLHETTRKIIDADRKYHYRCLYIDDGGLGVAVFQDLLREPQTSGRTIAINNAHRSLDTSDKPAKRRLMKEDLYANLLKLMEQGRIALFNDEEIFYSLSSVQYEINDRQELRVSGNNTHVCEALARAAFCMDEKHLNLWCAYR